MCIESLRWAFTVPGLTTSEGFVLVALAWHHNAATGRCDPSVHLLMEDTRLSRRAVQGALRSLEERELIASASGGGGRMRSSYSLAYRGAAGAPLAPSGGALAAPLEAQELRLSPNGVAPLEAQWTAPRGALAAPDKEGTTREQEGAVATRRTATTVCPWPHCRLDLRGPRALADHMHNVHDDEEPW